MKQALILLIGILLLAACNSPDSAWQTAEREDTITAYLEFLARYPDGELADRARERILVVKENSAWEHVEFKDNLNNYASFLKEFPDTDRRPMIAERTAELELQAAWKLAQGTNTIKGYQLFIDGHPDVSLAVEAEGLIAELIAAQEPEEVVITERAGNFRVQLGTFRTVAAAEIELRRLVALFPDTLIGPPWIETPEHGGGGKVYRLKTVPMTGEEARASCAALKRFRQDCLVINR